MLKIGHLIFMPRGERVACPWVPTDAKMVMGGTDLLSLHQRRRVGFLREEGGKVPEFLSAICATDSWGKREDFRWRGFFYQTKV